jgi:hypothetical protein
MHRFIDGEDRMQQTLLPHCLEDYVGEENPVRVIEVIADLKIPPGFGFPSRLRDRDAKRVDAPWSSESVMKTAFFGSTSPRLQLAIPPVAARQPMLSSA